MLLAKSHKNHVTVDEVFFCCDGSSSDELEAMSLRVVPFSKSSSQLNLVE